MKALKFALVASVVFLSACGTPQEKATRQADTYERLFGPTCTAMGFKQGTEAYASCKLQLSTAK